VSTDMAPGRTWRDMVEDVSNWGRWGEDDQLGTLNLIGPDEVRAAGSLIRRGQVIPLGVPLDGWLPNSRTGFRRNPMHIMVVDGGDDDLAEKTKGFVSPGSRNALQVMHGGFRFTEDMLILPSQAGTQWDGVGHVYYDGLMYNGYPAATITSFGASRCGMEQAARHGVAGRGVFLDVARHHSAAVLPSEYAISPAELDEVAASEGVEVRSGDIVVIRTGAWGKFLVDRDGREYLLECAGLSWECAVWAHQHNVAAIAMDNSQVEVLGDGTHPLHRLAIRNMGMLLGEIWNLEALSEACAVDGAYEFFLDAQPLDVPGAVGASINPLAIR
jgi:kynurenine formamidase